MAGSSNPFGVAALGALLQQQAQLQRQNDYSLANYAIGGDTLSAYSGSTITAHINATNWESVADTLPVRHRSNVAWLDERVNEMRVSL